MSLVAFRQRFSFIVAMLACLVGNRCTSADDFASDWQRQYDRIWIGQDYWANPMEDWRLKSGRAVCISRGGDRNLHVLTHQLEDAAADFELSVRATLVERGNHAGVGFRVGIHDDINDHRGNCLWGEGIDAGVVNGKLVVATRTRPLPNDANLNDVMLKLSCAAGDDGCVLKLTVRDGESNQMIAQLSSEPIAAAELIGNVALVSNLRLPQNKRTGSTYAFADFRGSGDKLFEDPDHAFGPILWTMYSISDSRTAAGYVLKLTALVPPLGENGPKQVALGLLVGDQPKMLTAPIDADSRTATFRIENWDPAGDVPYRVGLVVPTIDGAEQPSSYTGTIRGEPTDRPLVLGGLTCQNHIGFPYAPVAENLKQLDPDLLFFSGDQLYEENGGYGIERNDADRAILNYLRKFYLFGWVFGDVMRDRPTLCIPDDHDVFHGNIWGEGGNGDATLNSGYAQPVRMVQVVHRTNCSHHPDFFDPTPAGQGISVYYGDLVWGRTSFAILGDRQFKSSPERVTTGKGRPDHVLDPDFDVSQLDKPGLELLGERQEKFLEAWIRDWRGADMKVLLSETVFANIATHHGGYDAYLRADLDSGGWPQTARNRALRIVRRALPLHVNGDQHLTTLAQYGIDKPRDGSWSFCTPAIAVGYPRWWRPEELGQTPTDRPDHGLPNTGLFSDGFEHPTYVYAVGNPESQNGVNRYDRSHNKASGFGIVRIDTKKRTYTCEAYRFDCDATNGPTPKNQFPGWPHTITQRENDGRAVAGFLEAVDLGEFDHPVVSVTNEGTKELLYSFPPTGKNFKPWVFAEGRYRIEIVDDSGRTNTQIESWEP